MKPSDYFRSSDPAFVSRLKRPLEKKVLRDLLRKIKKSQTSESPFFAKSDDSSQVDDAAVEAVLNELLSLMNGASDVGPKIRELFFKKDGFNTSFTLAREIIGVGGILTPAQVDECHSGNPSAATVAVVVKAIKTKIIAALRVEEKVFASFMLEKILEEGVEGPFESEVSTQALDFDRLTRPDQITLQPLESKISAVTEEVPKAESERDAIVPRRVYFLETLPKFLSTRKKLRLSSSMPSFPATVKDLAAVIVKKSGEAAKADDEPVAAVMVPDSKYESAKKHFDAVAGLTAENFASFFAIRGAAGSKSLVLTDEAKARLNLAAGVSDTDAPAAADPHPHIAILRAFVEEANKLLAQDFAAKKPPKMEMRRNQEILGKIFPGRGLGPGPLSERYRVAEITKIFSVEEGSEAKVPLPKFKEFFEIEVLDDGTPIIKVNPEKITELESDAARPAAPRDCVAVEELKAFAAHVTTNYKSDLEVEDGSAVESLLTKLRNGSPASRPAPVVVPTLELSYDEKLFFEEVEKALIASGKTIADLYEIDSVTGEFVLKRGMLAEIIKEPTVVAASASSTAVPASTSAPVVSEVKCKEVQDLEAVIADFVASIPPEDKAKASKFASSNPMAAAKIFTDAMNKDAAFAMFEARVPWMVADVVEGFGTNKKTVRKVKIVEKRVESFVIMVAADGTPTITINPVKVKELNDKAAAAPASVAASSPASVAVSPPVAAESEAVRKLKTLFSGSLLDEIKAKMISLAKKQNGDPITAEEFPSAKPETKTAALKAAIEAVILAHRGEFPINGLIVKRKVGFGKAATEVDAVMVDKFFVYFTEVDKAGRPVAEPNIDASGNPVITIKPEKELELNSVPVASPSVDAPAISVSAAAPTIARPAAPSVYDVKRSVKELAIIVGGLKDYISERKGADIALITAGLETLITSPAFKKIYRDSIRYAALEKDDRYKYLIPPLTKEEVELYKSFNKSYQSAVRLVIRHKAKPSESLTEAMVTDCAQVVSCLGPVQEFLTSKTTEALRSARATFSAASILDEENKFYSYFVADNKAPAKQVGSRTKYFGKPYSDIFLEVLSEDNTPNSVKVRSVVRGFVKLRNDLQSKIRSAKSDADVKKCFEDFETGLAEHLRQCRGPLTEEETKAGKSPLLEGLGKADFALTSVHKARLFAKYEITKEESNPIGIELHKNQGSFMEMMDNFLTADVAEVSAAQTDPLSIRRNIRNFTKLAKGKVLASAEFLVTSSLRGRDAFEDEPESIRSATDFVVTRDRSEFDDAVARCRPEYRARKVELERLQERLKFIQDEIIRLQKNVRDLTERLISEFRSRRKDFKAFEKHFKAYLYLGLEDFEGAMVLPEEVQEIFDKHAGGAPRVNIADLPAEERAALLREVAGDAAIKEMERLRAELQSLRETEAESKRRLAEARQANADIEAEKTLLKSEVERIKRDNAAKAASNPDDPEVIVARARVSELERKVRELEGLQRRHSAGGVRDADSTVGEEVVVGLPSSPVSPKLGQPTEGEIEAESIKRVAALDLATSLVKQVPSKVKGTIDRLRGLTSPLREAAASPSPFRTPAALIGRPSGSPLAPSTRKRRPVFASPSGDGDIEAMSGGATPAVLGASLRRAGQHSIRPKNYETHTFSDGDQVSGMDRMFVDVGTIEDGKGPMTVSVDTNHYYRVEDVRTLLTGLETAAGIYTSSEPIVFAESLGKDDVGAIESVLARCLADYQSIPGDKKDLQILFPLLVDGHWQILGLKQNPGQEDYQVFIFDSASGRSVSDIAALQKRVSEALTKAGVKIDEINPAQYCSIMVQDAVVDGVAKKIPTVDCGPYIVNALENIAMVGVDEASASSDNVVGKEVLERGLRLRAEQAVRMAINGSTEFEGVEDFEVLKAEVDRRMGREEIVLASAAVLGDIFDRMSGGAGSDDEEETEPHPSTPKAAGVGAAVVDLEEKRKRKIAALHEKMKEWSQLDGVMTRGWGDDKAKDASGADISGSEDDDHFSFIVANGKKVLLQFDGDELLDFFVGDAEQKPISDEGLTFLSNEFENYARQKQLQEILKLFDSYKFETVLSDSGDVIGERCKIGDSFLWRVTGDRKLYQIVSSSDVIEQSFIQHLSASGSDTSASINHYVGPTPKGSKTADYDALKAEERSSLQDVVALRLSLKDVKTHEPLDVGAGALSEVSDDDETVADLNDFGPDSADEDDDIVPQKNSADGRLALFKSDFDASLNGVITPAELRMSKYSFEDEEVEYDRSDLPGGKNSKETVKRNDDRFYYAEFVGLKFDESSVPKDASGHNAAPGIFNDAVLFMANFRNCAFKDVDFSQMGEILDTIQFANCTFEGKCKFPDGFVFKKSSLKGTTVDPLAGIAAQAAKDSVYSESPSGTVAVDEAIKLSMERLSKPRVH